MNKYSSSLAFTDLLFNLLLAFVGLFVLSFLLINPESDSGKIDPNAEFIIMLSWDKNSSDDIDLWIEDPNEERVWFANREGELIHLDRDARGTSRGSSESESSQDNNQEIMTIRGYIKGQYVVNVHGYSVYRPPVKAEVQVIKLNPYSIVCEENIVITRSSEEITICRFYLDSDGKVKDKNKLYKKLFGA